MIYFDVGLYSDAISEFQILAEIEHSEQSKMMDYLNIMELATYTNGSEQAFNSAQNHISAYVAINKDPQAEYIRIVSEFLKLQKVVLTMGTYSHSEFNRILALTSQYQKIPTMYWEFASSAVGTKKTLHKRKMKVNVDFLRAIRDVTIWSDGLYKKHYSATSPTSY